MDNKTKDKKKRERDQSPNKEIEEEEELKEKKSKKSKKKEDNSDDESGEDLFGDEFNKDYEKRPELDNYELDLLAENEDIEAPTYESRYRAEEAMQKRDYENYGKLDDSLIDEINESGEDEEKVIDIYETDDLNERFREEESEEESDEKNRIDLNKKNAPLDEFLKREGVKNEVKRRFSVFLHTFMDPNGKNIYMDKIRTLCAENRETLEVSYLHMSMTIPIITMWVADEPKVILKVLDEVSTELVTNLFFRRYKPTYNNRNNSNNNNMTSNTNNEKYIKVRIINFPSIENVRDLRQSHLNYLVKVRGVVTRRSDVLPQVVSLVYDCLSCNTTLGPFVRDEQTQLTVDICPNCNKRGPFVNEKAIYRNYQSIVLQESPGTVPAGRLPRSKQVILTCDLVGLCAPGEEIEVTGIYKHSLSASLNKKHGFPVFSTVIEANHISKKEDISSNFHLTKEDISEIEKLSKSPFLSQKIVNSIAPSIFGHQDIKLVLALALFGGVSLNKSSHNVRGDINVLLMGDPGTAKSQFLKYIEKTAYRSVFATGQGASAVGLTASFKKDKLTNKWTLEGGAMVLADRGVCLIDEFDKMNDKDRTSIHEAMEQQSISLSKAGIVTTLQARCTVIAAANPIKGRYDSSIPFSSNVNLTEPILSRFDVLCVVKDVVDPVVDEKLSSFVVESHQKNHPLVKIENETKKGMEREFFGNKNSQKKNSQKKNNKKNNKNDKSDKEDIDDEDMEDDDFDEIDLNHVDNPLDEKIPQSLLRKYIFYAKSKIRPTLDHPSISQKLTNVFAELRGQTKNSGFAVNNRHMEAMIRLCTASAKMHLRTSVIEEDVDVAIKVMVNSVIGAQKFSSGNLMKQKFGKYIGSKDSDNYVFLYNLLLLMFGDKKKLANISKKKFENQINLADFEDKAKENEIFNVFAFYSSPIFKKKFVYDPKNRVITPKRKK